MLVFLRRHRQGIFVGTISTFLIGIFVGLGGYLFVRSDVSEAVAAVGSAKIPYQEYRLRLDQYLEVVRDQGTELTDSTQGEIKQGILRDMIVDELLFLKARELGLVVSDLELAADIERNPNFSRDGRFDKLLYLQALRYSLRISPRQYEESRRRLLSAAKLRALVLQSAKITPRELEEEFAAQGSKPAKDLQAAKAQFAQTFQQMRALDLLNQYLRQVTAKVEIKSYLEQRERGVQN